MGSVLLARIYYNNIRIMKKNLVYVFGIMLIGVWGCSMDNNFIQPEVTRSTDFAQFEYSNSGSQTFVQDQVIIQFTDKNITHAGKESLRSQYKQQFYFEIIDIETCDCDNDNLELWTILPLPGFLGVENLVSNLKKKAGTGDMNGDGRHSITILSDSIPEDEHVSTISEKIVTTNSTDAVNIAILDTGIDYDYFKEPFLYNSNGNENCENEVSGWDFVNNDNDPRDDHGHGTYVTRIITDALDTAGIPYQILPIKAFDENGRGDYWTVLCALNYISKKPGRFITNMSFGYYNFPNQIILKNIMDDMEDRVLIVASAGNEGLDTDTQGNEHFPSGYSSNNVLTTGGYAMDDIAWNIDEHNQINGLGIAPGSNFGYSSIDVLAPFDEYAIRLTSPGRHIIEDTVAGTSFSSAYVTARAAQLFHENAGSPSAVKGEVINSGYLSRSLFGLIKTQRIIVPNNINDGGLGPISSSISQRD